MSIVNTSKSRECAHERENRREVEKRNANCLELMANHKKPTIVQIMFVRAFTTRVLEIVSHSAGEMSL